MNIETRLPQQSLNGRDWQFLIAQYVRKKNREMLRWPYKSCSSPNWTQVTSPLLQQPQSTGSTLKLNDNYDAELLLLQFRHTKEIRN